MNNTLKIDLTGKTSYVLTAKEGNYTLRATLSAPMGQITYLPIPVGGTAELLRQN